VEPEKDLYNYLSKHRSIEIIVQKQYVSIFRPFRYLLWKWSGKGSSETSMTNGTFRGAMVL